MNAIAIQKKILFHNLALCKGENVLLLNLFTFRRALITSDEYAQLRFTSEKLETGGVIDDSDAVYLKLYDRKQILNDSLIRRIDEAALPQPDFVMGPVRDAEINLTYACNLNCGYCYQKAHKKYTGHVMPGDVEKIYQFIDSFNRGEKLLEKVTISGGEPLLEQNIETINTILRVFDGCLIKMFTNGINITKYAHIIDFSRIDEFQISLDGFNDTIQKISGNSCLDVYERIIEGILYLAQTNCSIVLVSLMSPGINTWLESFLNDLCNRGVFKDNVSMRIAIPIIPGSTDVINQEYFSIEEYFQIRKFLQNSGWKKKVSLDMPTGFSAIQSKIYRHLNDRVEGKVRSCNLEKKVPLTFGPNGLVSFCNCMHPGHGVAGNYNSGTVDYNFLKDVYHRSVFVIEECRNCDMRYLCASGCPGELFAVGRNLYKPVCKEFNSDQLVERLEEIVL